jgi:hypothetical protein
VDNAVADPVLNPVECAAMLQLGGWWLKFYVRVCSWGLDLQFYSTSTVNKEMCP